MRPISIMCLVIFLVCSVPVLAQEELPAGGPKFGLELGLGVHTFPDESQEVSAYQFLSITPDMAFGKIGFGLDLTLHYRFTGNGADIEVRQEDWYRETVLETVALYLSKIRYVRYCEKGEPLYVKLGSIDDAVLGNGFLVSGYANTQFLPDTRLFGMSLDLDGALFDFPFGGVETFVGDLSAFDLLAARLYARPLVTTGIPVLEYLEIGATVAADRTPLRFAQDAAGEADGPVVMYGADFLLPVLVSPVVSLAAFGDVALQHGAAGGMLGFGGRLLGFLNYGAQLRLLGENFVPAYFDAAYDLYRAEKYAIYSKKAVFPGYVGWLASTGFTAFDENLVFTVSLDGPFGTPAGSSGNFSGADLDPSIVDNPHLRGMFVLNKGLVPGFSFSAGYDKRAIASFGDLFSAENAVIFARLNLSSGPAVITLTYDLKYNPFAEDGETWEVTSGLETRISLF
jgi:hypothetical protein